MSSEINTLSDLHRDILRLLMAGWQTMDQTKAAGMVRLDELSARFGLPPEEMRQELALLEAIGLVDNVHSMGMDQTQYYKGFDQVGKRKRDEENPSYFITENGKRRVVADIASDEGSTASPA